MREKEEEEEEAAEFETLPNTLAAIPSYHLCNTRTLYLATDNDHDISSRQDQRPCPCPCPYPVTHHHHHHHLQTPSQHSTAQQPKQSKTTTTNRQTTYLPTPHYEYTTTTNRPAIPACISWFPTVSLSVSHQIQSVLAHLVTPARGARIPARLTGLCRACH